VTVLAGVILAGCTSSGSPAAGRPGSATVTTSAAATADQACRADFTPRTLPSWARTGFTPPTSPMPYVLGDRGDIVAILWATHAPLVVPPATDRNNKILWVSRVSWSAGSPLRIRATLADSGRTATRTVDGGPGPSIIDLPAPGYWSLDLTWGDHHDHLQLEYVPR